MGSKKAFPLRLDPELYEALRRWADTELRSVNGQIEYILRQAVRSRGAQGGKAKGMETGGPGSGGDAAAQSAGPDDAPKE